MVGNVWVSPYCLICTARNDDDGHCTADAAHDAALQRAVPIMSGPTPADTASIKLSPHHGRQLWALVSLEDFDRVAALGAWTVNSDADGRMYAWTVFKQAGARVDIAMGEVVLGPRPGPQWRLSYGNGNGLDNRRSNVAWGQQSQVLAKRRPAGGSSQFKGVTWDRSTGKWQAAFRGKKLGRFCDEVEAAEAFDAAAFAHWGPGCYLNFPQRHSNER